MATIITIQPPSTLKDRLPDVMQEAGQLVEAETVPKTPAVVRAVIDTEHGTAVR